MTRAFQSTPVAREQILECLDLAVRSPSAGKSQGWHFIVLDGADTARFWDITLPRAKRVNFSWPHLLDAPCIILPCADASMYVARYSEPDKSASGLGKSAEAWPIPYWTIDTSFAAMTLLLAFENIGLGSLFFGIFEGESALRDELGIPAKIQIIGAIAVGTPLEGESRRGLSAKRTRRTAHEVAYFGGWPRAR